MDNYFEYEASKSLQPSPSPLTKKGESQTLLFAEDEMALALVIKQHLESNGFTVLLAHDGTEAVQLYTAYQGEIDLAVLDIDLPILDGTKVLQKIHRMNPQQKIILTSGYFVDTEKNFIQHNTSVEFLQKPYHPEELLKKIRDVLDTMDSSDFIQK